MRVEVSSRGGRWSHPAAERRIRRHCATRGGRGPLAGVPIGPGDDAAVVDAPDGRVVVTTDMLVEGRHFRLDWSTPHDVGRKAVAQNAADIEAMGARVTAFVVAFGAPADTPVSAAEALTAGMWLEAGAVGAGIVGGDLVASPSGWCRSRRWATSAAERRCCAVERGPVR